MAPTAATTTIKRNEFRAAVRRNVRTLLGMCDVEQQDLAPAIGLSKSQLSDRLTMSAAWKDEELLNVAHAFGVNYEVVVALTPEAFHQALTLSGPPSPRIHGLTGSVQLNLLDFAA